MTFTQEPVVTPTSVGAIHINLVDKPASGEDPQIRSVEYQVHILDQNGSEMTIREGNLIPHLSQTDIDWLLDFGTRMRTKASDEFLP